MAAGEGCAARKRGRPPKDPTKAAAAPKKRGRPSARSKAAANKKMPEAAAVGPKLTPRPEVALVEKHYKVRTLPDPLHISFWSLGTSRMLLTLTEPPQDMVKIVERLKRIDEYGFFCGVAESRSPEKSLHEHSMPECAPAEVHTFEVALFFWLPWLLTYRRTALGPGQRCRGGGGGGRAQFLSSWGHCEGYCGPRRWHLRCAVHNGTQSGRHKGAVIPIVSSSLIPFASLCLQ